MAHREILTDWIVKALRALGGQARIVEVAKKIWEQHETEIRRAGDFFYEWQYEMRWAARELRKRKALLDATATPRGVWALKK
jgi:hypothetical protein